MKVREVPRSGVLAWGHARASRLLATGTAAGTMSETFDPSGALELWACDLTVPGSALRPVASLKTDNKLNRLLWTRPVALAGADKELGVLVGAMDSGSVALWDPAKLARNEPAHLHNLDKHVGAVQALDENPLQASLIASGSASGELLVWDLGSLQAFAPSSQKSPSGDAAVRALGWNAKVKHILASGASNGFAVVWDLRAKRAVVTCKEAQTTACSALVWSPQNQTMLVTASDDDRAPGLHVWDLKNTYAPVATLTGHGAGVLSLAWHPSEDLLLSGGKDERVLCWDMARLELRTELEVTRGWKSDVAWADVPAVIATASLAGTVEVFAMHDYRTPTGAAAPPTPPPWLARRSCAAFGFGGKLVTVSGTSVGVHVVHADTAFVEHARTLQASLHEGRLVEYCEAKARAQNDDRYVWRFLQVLFNEDARSELLTTLGYSREAIEKEVASLLASLPPLPEEQSENGQHHAEEQPKESTYSHESPFASSHKSMSGFFGQDDGEDVFDFSSLAQPLTASSVSTQGRPSVPPSPALLSKMAEWEDTSPINFAMKEPSEVTLTKALIIGNFADAVDVCVRQGRWADALVIAAIGGAPLLLRTQARYVRHCKSDLLRVVALLARKDYGALIERTDAQHWRRVLAIISVYAEPDQFQPLCEQLGDRLAEHGDESAALLTYICAGSLDKVAEHWLRAAGSDTRALHGTIEKLAIFTAAVHSDEVAPAVAEVYARYADALASEGELEVALEYLQALQQPQLLESSAGLLHHRLSHALGSEARAAVTPFEVVNVQGNTASHGARPMHPQNPQAPSWMAQQTTPARPGAPPVRGNAPPFGGAALPPSSSTFGAPSPSPFSPAPPSFGARPPTTPTPISSFPSQSAPATAFTPSVAPPPRPAQPPSAPPLSRGIPPQSSPPSSSQPPSAPPMSTPGPIRAVPTTSFTPSAGALPPSFSSPSPGSQQQVQPPRAMPIVAPPAPHTFKPPTPSYSPPPTRLKFAASHSSLRGSHAAPAPAPTVMASPFAPPTPTFAASVTPTGAPLQPQPQQTPSSMPSVTPLMPSVTPSATPPRTMASPARGAAAIVRPPVSSTPTSMPSVMPSAPPQAHPSVPSTASPLSSTPTPSAPPRGAGPPPRMPTAVAPPPTVTPSQPPQTLPPPPTSASAPARAREAPPPSVDAGPVAAALRNTVAKLKGAVEPQYARHVADLEGRLLELAESCESGKLSAKPLAVLKELVQALDGKNYDGAAHVHSRLNSEHYGEIGSKCMIGLKRLLPLAQQYQL